LKLEIPSEPVVLDDILISLQSEINAEIEEMETEFEEGITCLSWTKKMITVYFLLVTIFLKYIIHVCFNKDKKYVKMMTF